ncbi:MAG: T9SS type A sorting domain-containing protein [Sphingobacteriales bacterium]|nr:MAG: T9SS type A sorting domain-containing protein [Sphingobacteriales bacterium]
MRNITFFFIFASMFLSAQTTNFTYFNKVYEADTMNMLSQAVRPVEDGYLVLGVYSSYAGRALYLLKIDLAGNPEWFKHIDDDPEVKGIEDGKFVLQVDSNSYIVVYAREKPDGWNETHLVKFTSIGEILWHKVHTTTNGSQTMRHIVSTSDGGIVMAGAQYIEGDTTRYYVLKTDAAGNFEWDKTYMLDNSSVAFSVQETPWDGGFIIGGYAVNAASGTLNYDAWVIKTDHLGDTLWTRTYGGEGNDCAAYVIPLTTHQEYFFEGKPIEYLLTGCTTVSGVNHLYLAKTDESGDIIWEKKYNSLGGVNPELILTYPIIIRSSNPLENRNIIGVCPPNLYGTKSGSMITKFYFNGNIAWYKKITCNPEADVYIQDMQPTSDGGYVLAGYQYTPPQKGWVLKIDAQGNTCFPVGCDSTMVVSAAELPVKTPVSLVQIYPNPVQNGGMLTLSHSLPAEFPVARFTLYNQIGKIVWKEEFNTWNRTKILQLPPGLPAGLYLWQVSYMGDVAGSGKIFISEK